MRHSQVLLCPRGSAQPLSCPKAFPEPSASPGHSAKCCSGCTPLALGCPCSPTPLALGCPCSPTPLALPGTAGSEGTGQQGQSPPSPSCAQSLPRFGARAQQFHETNEFVTNGFVWLWVQHAHSPLRHFGACSNYV